MRDVWGHLYKVERLRKCEGLWRRGWDSAAVYQPIRAAARAVIVSSFPSESCVVQNACKIGTVSRTRLVAVAEVVGCESHQGGT